MDLLWAVSQERGCVVFGQHQAGRKGGEKQDAIGTGHGQGPREPWLSSRGTEHCSMVPGAGRQHIQSVPVPRVYNLL